jgi:hypothetical protein
MDYVGEGGHEVVGEFYDIPLTILRDHLVPAEPPELELGLIELADGAACLATVLRKPYPGSDELIYISETTQTERTAMPTSNGTDTGWRTSSFSADERECVEVSAGRRVRVRDTKNRPGGMLILGQAQWRAVPRSWWPGWPVRSSAGPAPAPTAAGCRRPTRWPGPVAAGCHGRARPSMTTAGAAGFRAGVLAAAMCSSSWRPATTSNPARVRPGVPWSLHRSISAPQRCPYQVQRALTESTLRRCMVRPAGPL